MLFFDNRPARKDVATKEVWYYDYRTNIHPTLKRKPLRLDDLAEFIACYHPHNRQKRKETWHAEKNPEGRWRKFTHAELVARDKTSLDLFWLKDDSLADLDNLPEPEILAEVIIENIEAGLANFRADTAALQARLGAAPR
jgi:type I restriction enzyme M protein